jgi:hypothetical protein
MSWKWVDVGNSDLFSFDDEGSFTAVSPYLAQSHGEFDGNEAGVLEMTYTCRQPGEFNIRFDPAWLRVVAEVESVGDSEVLVDSVEVSIKGEMQLMPGRCVELPATATPTGTPDPGSEGGGIGDGEGRTVLMVVIDGIYYPASQFDVLASGVPEPEHSCARPHYHAKDGELAVGLVAADTAELDFFGDPQSLGCGFGLFDELERVNLELTREQVDALLEWLRSPL